MAVQAGSPAPYAPPAAVLAVIERYRERGLPVPFTLEVLTRAGISGSLAPRTLQALRILDLIDADGNPTGILEGLRRARTEEYQPRFQEFLRSAYPDVFAYVDPAQDSEERIRDQFRDYEPHGQRGRMVSLFLGLAAAAGLRPAGSNGSRTEGVTRPTRTAKTARSGRNARTESEEQPSGSSENSRGSTQAASPPPQTQTIGGAEELPPALAGLVKTLPKDGAGWSRAQRERFVTAFIAVVDLLYPTDGGE